jgi:hypothetical protein
MKKSYINPSCKTMVVRNEKFMVESPTEPTVTPGVEGGGDGSGIGWGGSGNGKPADVNKPYNAWDED